MVLRRLLFANLLCAAIAATAQERPRPGFLPPIVSPEVSVEKRVTFRIRAASANRVRLESSDLGGFGGGPALVKGDGGVWSVTVGPLAPGAYRYAFDVDGVRVLDPANTSASESNAALWSLVNVSGSEWFDTKDVPHGAVSEVFYRSKALNQNRRMHVYTPPGYGKGSALYPVLYLLHGAFDCDNSWPTVGRAGIILDNLIAAGRAVPMIVVMPNGHAGTFSFGQPNALERQVAGFLEEFLGDVRPLVERTYRVKPGAANRAIAGLSMGGAQTLEIAARALKDFSHYGVFSSGIFGLAASGATPAAVWAERNKAVLSDKGTKRGIRLVWFATGKEDFLIETSRATVKELRANGFDVTYKETEGAHTWLCWRDYLAEFAPLLFRSGAK